MAKISRALKALTISRSQGYCEYCKSPADFTTEPFSIEHIIPRSKQGTNDAENLAYSCIGCNVYKSDRTEYIDRILQEMIPIFNPRMMQWSDHFMWDESYTMVIGKSPTGRATVDALKLNRKPLKNLRRALIAIDEHPPKN